MKLDLNADDVAIIRDCLNSRLTTLNNLALRPRSKREARADLGDRASRVNAVLEAIKGQTDGETA